jgi:hypothetical protein
MPTRLLQPLSAVVIVALCACTNGGKNKRSDTSGINAGTAAGQVSPIASPGAGAIAPDSSAARAGTTDTAVRRASPAVQAPARRP